MGSELEIITKSFMELTLTDAASLSQFISEGQARRATMKDVRERFPDVLFTTTPELNGNVYAFGDERDINMVKDCVLNARKYAAKFNKYLASPETPTAPY